MCAMSSGFFLSCHRRTSCVWILAPVVLAFAVAHCSATIYSFSRVSSTSTACTQASNTRGSCMGGNTWTDVSNAEAVGADFASVTMAGGTDCSQLVHCQGVSASWPLLSSSWSGASVSQIDVDVSYSFSRNADTFTAVINAAGATSTAQVSELASASATTLAMPSSSYNQALSSAFDLNSSSFGVTTWFSSRGGPSMVYSFDGITVSVSFGGDASVSSASPHDNLDVGHVITVSGSFFDTRDLSLTPRCVFQSAAPTVFTIAGNVTASSVHCPVPDLGAQAGTFTLSVRLDDAQPIIAPGTLVYYKQAEPVEEEPQSEEEQQADDDDDSAAPEGTTPGLVTALVASVAAAAVIASAVAAVVIRRRSAGIADDEEKISTGKETASQGRKMQSAGAKDKKQSSIGKKPSIKAATSGASSSSKVSSTSGTNRAPVKPSIGVGSVEKASDATGSKKPAASGRTTGAAAGSSAQKPARARRPSVKGRPKRAGSAPLRAPAGAKKKAQHRSRFQTTPVAMFATPSPGAELDDHRMTMKSVTSMQAPFFGNFADDDDV